MNHDSPGNLVASARGKWGLDPKKPIYILSPHLDDAIWSMGELLHQLAAAGYEIHVVNLFSYTVFIQGEVQPPAEATKVRKAEDLQAAHAVGIRSVVCLDYPDGVLRDTPVDGVLNSGYQTPAYLLEMLTAALRKVLPAEVTVLAPMALGGHMDHLTTRRAALLLGRPLGFFEDLPYAARPHDIVEEEAFKAKQGLSEMRMPLEQAQIDAHLDYYEMYPSQCADIDRNQISAYLSDKGYGFWA